jgi:hypothetical protein
MGSKTEIIITAKRQYGFIGKVNMHTLLTDSETILSITTRRFAFS